MTDETETVLYHYIDEDGYYVGSFDKRAYAYASWTEVPDQPLFGTLSRLVHGSWQNHDGQRKFRSSLLEEYFDPIYYNSGRWNGLSEAKKQEWLDYRKALLDISSQEGFPDNVDYPEPPID